MKKIYQYTLLFSAAALLLTSCTGPTSGPGRKKMPEFTEQGDDFSNMHLFQSSPGLDMGSSRFGFSTSFTSVAFNGGAKDCAAVTVPESLDQQAFALIGLYKPFAPTLIAQWSKQPNNGIVIDFSDGTDQKRSDYMIESKGNPDVPVIVLWNDKSSKRLATYLAQLSDVPGISLKTLSK
jgi:hypothetical protein